LHAVSIIKPEDVEKIELAIDEADNGLPAINNFVLPWRQGFGFLPCVPNGLPPCRKAYLGFDGSFDY
jgi:hypothetical protein